MILDSRQRTRSTRGSRRNPGVSTLALVILMLLGAQVLMMVWSNASRQTLLQARRSAEGQRILEVGRSALAETVANLNRAANDPDGAYYRIFRHLDDPSPSISCPPLVSTWELFGGIRDWSIDVQCLLNDYICLCRDPLNASGRLRLQVEIRSPKRVSRTLVSLVSFRVQKITLPEPMDSWVIAPCDPESSLMEVLPSFPPVLPEALVANPFEVLQSSWTTGNCEIQTHDLFLPWGGKDAAGLWKKMAALIVPQTYAPRPGSGQASVMEDLFPSPARLEETQKERVLGSWMTDQLQDTGRINGVVFWDDLEKGIRQKLQFPPFPNQESLKEEHPNFENVKFRGKCILVAMNGLDLGDIEVEDTRFDKLTIVSFGPVSVPKGEGRKRWQADVIMCEQKSTPQAAWMSDVAIRGSLIDLTQFVNSTSPPSQSSFVGTIEPHPHAKANNDPSHIVVLFGPHVCQEALKR